MSKKDYEMIARVLKYHGETTPRTVEYIAKDLAEQFSKDNPAFNTERFMKAVVKA